LLERSAHETYRDGRVICVAGDVRNHVSSSAPLEWQEQLKTASARLMILEGNSRECSPNAADQAEIDDHLSREAATRKEVDAAWEVTRQEIAELDRQAEFESRRGCGLRSCWPGAMSAFRRGDLVYAPPTGSSPPGVAVIFDVERAFGFGAAACVPTGYVRLLIWDVHASRFTCSLRSSDQNLSFCHPVVGVAPPAFTYAHRSHRSGQTANPWLFVM